MSKLNKKNKKKIRSLLLCICALLIIGISVIVSQIDITKERMVNYQGKTNLGYDLILNDGSIADKQVKVSDLKTINLNINYDFRTDVRTNLTYTYSVTGLLKLNKLNDSNDTNSSIQRSYNLLDETEVNVGDDNKYSLNKSLPIDISTYRDLVTGWTSDGDDSLGGELIIYVDIQNKNSLIDDKVESKIVIPLTDEYVSIDETNGNIDNNYKIEKSVKLKINIKSICGFILIGFALLIIVKTIKYAIVNSLSSTKYENYVNDILTKNDNNIVESDYIPTLSDFTVIKINKFKELLDVKKVYKEPIMFARMKTRKESIFFIKHDKDLYLYKIKEDDFKEE